LAVDARRARIGADSVEWTGDSPRREDRP